MKTLSALPEPVDFDLFDWLPPAQQEMVATLLQAPMPRGRETLVYRTLPRHLEDRTVDGKRHILFTGYYPYASLVKKSMTLRRTGRYYTTLLAACVREDAASLDSFDECYEIKDYQELLQLLLRCGTHRVHALIQPWMFGVAAVSAGRTTHVPTVVEVNDSMLFIDRDAVFPTCRMEAEILRHTDFFTHKMPEAAVDEMRRAWHLAIPDVQIHSLPVRDYFSDCSCFNGSEPLRIAFAGGVMPYAVAKKYGHEGHIFDPLIKTICSGRASLDFFVNRNARNMYWEEHAWYLAFERRYPNFRFLKGVPLHELPKRLSDYHVAVYYENSEASSYNPKHFTYNMATKIFSYIEAGLPILVPASAVYIKDFLLERGMGIVYDMPRLPAVLAGIDGDTHRAIRANIERYRSRNDMASLLPALESLYC